MRQTRSLLNNTLIFAISNFASKFLGFFMIPFYTSVLTKEEFGSADLINTTVALLVPIFSLSMANAALRYALDETVNKSNVFTFGIKIIFGGFILLICFAPVFLYFNLFVNHLILFYSLYLSSILQTYFSLFARGINKIPLIGVAGVVHSFILVISNILLLYFFEWGIDGFILSMIIANLVSSALLFLRGRMFDYIAFDQKDPTLSKEMISYSLPLIPNALSWSINRASDRYFINYFCTPGDLGLYSAAVRMPSILMAIQGVFVQAWQISAISEYDKEDNIPFFSTIYKFYNVIMILGSSTLIITSKYIAHILFSGSFYEAWIFTPFLFVSVVFGSLVGFYSSFYLAHKKTKVLLLSTFLGALATLLLNFVLVPIMGPMGSAISNVTAYFCVWLYLHTDSRKFLKLDVKNNRFYFFYILLLVQAFLVIYGDSLLFVSCALLIYVVIFILTWKELKQMYVAGKNGVRKFVRKRAVGNNQKNI